MAVTRMVVQDAAFNAELGSRISRLDNLAPLYRDIEEILLNSMRERFLSQTSPEGIPWAKLSPAYAKSKEKRTSQFPTAIGRLNGYLMGLLRKGGDATHAEVGSDRVYANMFQFGGTSFAGQKVGHVKLRTDARGNLVRNERGGAVFAGPRHKRFDIRTYATGYFEISQPGRPFAGFSAADRLAVAEAVSEYLQGR
jgi:phage gpG-like protein